MRSLVRALRVLLFAIYIAIRFLLYGLAGTSGLAGRWAGMLGFFILAEMLWYNQDRVKEWSEKF